MRLLLTGAAGFIGSALCRLLIRETDWHVVNLDALTYAGNLRSLAEVEGHPRYRFEHADIRDRAALQRIFAEHHPDGVIHLAAESHVDRSIDGPATFVHTNIVGTYELLQASLAHWTTLDQAHRERFRFHHVSTDEVFGSLGATGAFVEETPYAPRSPYSATKAASDHLVQAWHHTYGLPVVISNCTNNYGPYHFPEKLIPLVILNALEGKRLPVYGDGLNVRDWLYVDDHARALQLIFSRGRVGERYNVGGGAERTNLEVVRTLCAIMDELSPAGAPHARLIEHVQDRPGHDRRYAIDSTKLKSELGWAPRESFETGLRRTVAWYLENRSWWQAVRDGTYRGERLGLLPTKESGK